MIHRLLLALCILCAPALAADEPAPAPPQQPPADAAARPKLPHLELNLQEKYVDAVGEVCLDEGLLELVVTVRSAKEHESVFLTKARPQNIHLSLLMLGLKPGHPGRWNYEGDEPIAIDPTGDKVAVSVIVPDKDGKPQELPINRFVKNRQTGELLASNVFIFGGSRIVDPPQPDEKPYYAADGSGDVIALVSFGDEMLSVPKAASNANDQLNFVVNPEVTPPVGTPVTIRFRPAK